MTKSLRPPSAQPTHTSSARPASETLHALLEEINQKPSLLGGGAGRQALCDRVVDTVEALAPQLASAQGVSRADRETLYSMQQTLQSRISGSHAKRADYTMARVLKQTLQNAEKSLMTQLQQSGSAALPERVSLAAAVRDSQPPGPVHSEATALLAELSRQQPAVDKPASLIQRAKSRLTQATTGGWAAPLQVARKLPVPQPATLTSMLQGAPGLPAAGPNLYASEGEKVSLSPQQQKIFDRVLLKLLESEPAARDYLKKHDMGHTRRLVIDGRRYFLTDTMARGGFGNVRAGVDEKGHLVAVKVVRLGRGPEKKTYYTPREEAEKEMDLMQKLQTPTMPLQHWMGKDKAGNEKLFMVMPYQQGDIGQLFARADAKAHASLCSRVGHDIAQISARLVDLGYMHADIKPNNMMYNHKGQATLIDFGLARQLDDQNMVTNGYVMGTYEYMPFEALSGDPFQGPAADRWGLGATLLAAGCGENILQRSQGRTDNRFADALVAMNAYKDWHANLPRRTGSRWRSSAAESTIDAAALALRDDRLSRGYVRARERLGARNADFIIQVLLNPDPRKRGTWGDTINFFAKQLAHGDAEAAKEAMRNLATDNVQLTAIGCLLRAHQAVEGT